MKRMTAAAVLVLVLSGCTTKITTSSTTSSSRPGSTSTAAADEGLAEIEASFRQQSCTIEAKSTACDHITELAMSGNTVSIKTDLYPKAENAEEASKACAIVSVADLARAYEVTDSTGVQTLWYCGSHALAGPSTFMKKLQAEG